MDNKTIANTIWNQMKTIDMNLVMCMGVTKLMVVERGLQFKVNGLKFRGLVEIYLNAGDTYDISFMTPRSKNIVKIYKDVYFDQVMPLLEDVVEREGLEEAV